MHVIPCMDNKYKREQTQLHTYLLLLHHIESRLHNLPSILRLLKASAPYLCTYMRRNGPQRFSSGPHLPAAIGGGGSGFEQQLHTYDFILRKRTFRLVGPALPSPYMNTYQ